MATRKQRRRREKELRHEYEVVYVDPDGNELDTPAVDGRNGREPRQPPARRDGRGQRRGAQRGGRTVDPPSWRRTIRRGLIFAPIFLATVLLLSGDRLTFAGAVLQTLLLLVVFVPFSYFMDRVMHRSALKRAARAKQ